MAGSGQLRSSACHASMADLPFRVIIAATSVSFGPVSGTHPAATPWASKRRGDWKYSMPALGRLPVGQLGESGLNQSTIGLPRCSRAPRTMIRYPSFAAFPFGFFFEVVSALSARRNLIRSRVAWANYGLACRLAGKVDAITSRVVG